MSSSSSSSASRPPLSDYFYDAIASADAVSSSAPPLYDQDFFDQQAIAWSEKNYQALDQAERMKSAMVSPRVLDLQPSLFLPGSPPRVKQESLSLYASLPDPLSYFPDPAPQTAPPSAYAQQPPTDMPSASLYYQPQTDMDMSDLAAYSAAAAVSLMAAPSSSYVQQQQQQQSTTDYAPASPELQYPLSAHSPRLVLLLWRRSRVATVPRRLRSSQQQQQQFVGAFGSSSPPALTHGSDLDDEDEDEMESGESEVEEFVDEGDDGDDDDDDDFVLHSRARRSR
ncbi:hypothetical protein EW146_g10038, partial [Bondarzewia mesenterica]